MLWQLLSSDINLQFFTIEEKKDHASQTELNWAPSGEKTSAESALSSFQLGKEGKTIDNTSFIHSLNSF